LKVLRKVLIIKIRTMLKKKKNIKKCGYQKLVSEEEQRWLDAYAARTSQLPSRIGIPYYD